MLKTILSVALTFATSVVLAAAPATPANLQSSVESILVRALGSEARVTSADYMAGSQVIEVQMVDGSMIHMLPDMKHIIFRGAIYKLGADSKTPAVNLTEAKQNPKRAMAIAAIKDDETVMFPAKGAEKAVINVFTDIDCGYCQKLHKEVPALNEMGITVRYLAFPRAGISDNRGQLTESFKKVDYVWCQGSQENKAEALTTMKKTQNELGLLARSKAGTSTTHFQELASQMATMVASSKGCNAPIEKEYTLGKTLGVTGTPAIVTQDGQLIPGYMPAEQLARKLNVL